MSQYITKNKLTRSQMDEIIKEKEKQIQSLQDENNTLHNILDHIPGNIYWYDLNGHFLGCNKSVAKLLNLSSPEEIVGKTHKSLFKPGLADYLDAINTSILASGTELYLEEEAINAENQPAIYLSKKCMLYDKNSRPTGIIGTSFDITDRKKIENELKTAKEKAVASDHAKSQFIAVMNHELSTPLASIIGLINIIKQKNTAPDENRKIIDTIENCTRHLLSLVNQVLDFSKLDKGNVNPSKSFIDLPETIDQVHNLLKINANNKGLELNTHIDSKINESIFTDARILRQILINLVNNAIKFTENGHITIEAKLLGRNHGMANIRITIEDTGCGIPPDKLNLIFEPFQQLNDTYVRQSSRSGTGLGLAIVKKLCEHLGINIHVSSTKGQGSTFTLNGEFKTGDFKSESSLLPIKKKDKTSKISPKTGNLMLAAKKLKVLMVEDDPVIQYIHKKMLDQFKCIVDVVSNGRDALKIIDAHDLVLVDINLPDISGFEVIKTIREKSNVPIIALTVHTGKKEKQASLKAGANKFICKPVSLNQLRGLLTDVLTRK